MDDNGYRPLTGSEKTALGKLLACLDLDVPCYVGVADYDTITSAQATSLGDLGYLQRSEKLVGLTHAGCKKALLLKRLYKYEFLVYEVPNGKP